MDEKKARNLATSLVSGLLRIALELLMVEAGGIEPPSASPLQAVLHT